MIGDGLVPRLPLLLILLRCWFPPVEDTSGLGDGMTGSDKVAARTAPVVFAAVVDLLLLLPPVRRC